MTIISNRTNTKTNYRGCSLIATYLEYMGNQLHIRFSNKFSSLPDLLTFGVFLIIISEDRRAGRKAPSEAREEVDRGASIV